MYNKIEFELNFVLCNNIKDKWFLTNNNDIVEMKNATLIGEEIFIYGRQIIKKQSFFSTPMNSEILLIFESNCKLLTNFKLYKSSNVKCKLIRIEPEKQSNKNNLKHNFVFIPLLHTIVN